jgi:hypothetical protein
MQFIFRIIWLVLALAVLALAVANRAPVVVSLDPLPFALEGPLWAALLAAGFVGLAFGALSVWIPGAKWRWRARRAEKRLGELESTGAVATTTPATLADGESENTRRKAE